LRESDAPRAETTTIGPARCLRSLDRLTSQLSIVRAANSVGDDIITVPSLLPVSSRTRAIAAELALAYAMVGRIAEALALLEEVGRDNDGGDHRGGISSMRPYSTAPSASR
jgi:hypothetical protein